MEQINKSEDVFYLSTDHLVESPVSTGLGSDLSNLARLIANATEAYTAAIFLKHPERNSLVVGGFHSLSREFITDAEIKYGSGLIGWTAANSVRVQVSPFEHDARTLLCYREDQSLKSFLALPILDNDKNVLGVITCDSKKTYAFPKIVEKLLADCSEQVRALIRLNLQVKTQIEDIPNETLPSFIEEIRNFEDERMLLSHAINVPAEIVDPAAIVAMVTAADGVGDGIFYSTSSTDNLQHRLLDLVCKHKKIICSDRTVQTLPNDDTSQRSFLSIPFHVLGKEAGSLNVLGNPQQVFNAPSVTALERITAELGKQIELIRLRERAQLLKSEAGLLSWRLFATEADQLLKQTQPRTLIRICFNNFLDLERAFGIDTSSLVFDKVLRLTEQLRRQSSLITGLYGSQILVLAETAHVNHFLSRLRVTLKTVRLDDPTNLAKSSDIQRIGEMLLEGISIIKVETSPEIKASIRGLIKETLLTIQAKSLENSTQKYSEVSSIGDKSNDFSWN